ncbi:MAG: GNAT family N-acetyltransferase [Rhodoferax sp.]|nr:GNAT family N-acetyltransferase [Rhodoferax sp.]
MSDPARFTDDIATLERATIDAVAPEAVEEIDGWLLPFDASTIGRAKSAVPLRHSSLQVADIAAIESRYAAHGLPAAFRLTDSVGLAPLHAELEERGYRADQPTLVQVANTRSILQMAANVQAQMEATAHPAWAAVYTTPGFDTVDGQHRIAALSRSHSAMYAHISQNGAPVAAGVGAYSQGWASIHGMRTVVSQRGQGLARSILVALAKEAQQRGIERFFLQVEEENAAATALYATAGFRTAWRYHYWRGA